MGTFGPMRFKNRKNGQKSHCKKNTLLYETLSTQKVVY